MCPVFNGACLGHNKASAAVSLWKNKTCVTIFLLCTCKSTATVGTSVVMTTACMWYILCTDHGLLCVGRQYCTLADENAWGYIHVYHNWLS